MEFNAQITERIYEILCKYIHIREISLNTCRNTLDLVCDLELFSKIRSHIVVYVAMYISTFYVASKLIMN